MTEHDADNQHPENQLSREDLDNLRVVATADAMHFTRQQIESAAEDLENESNGVFILGTAVDTLTAMRAISSTSAFAEGFGSMWNYGDVLVSFYQSYVLWQQAQTSTLNEQTKKAYAAATMFSGIEGAVTTSVSVMAQEGILKAAMMTAGLSSLGTIGFAVGAWVAAGIALNQYILAEKKQDPAYVFKDRVMKLTVLPERITALEKRRDSLEKVLSEDQTLTPKKRQKMNTQWREAKAEIKRLTGKQARLTEEACALYCVHDLSNQNTQARLKLSHTESDAIKQFEDKHNLKAKPMSATSKEHALSKSIADKQADKLQKRREALMTFGMAALGVTLLACAAIPGAQPLAIAGIALCAVACGFKAKQIKSGPLPGAIKNWWQKRRDKKALYQRYRTGEHHAFLAVARTVLGNGASHESLVKHRIAYEKHVKHLVKSPDDVPTMHHETAFYTALRDKDNFTKTSRNRLIDAAVDKHLADEAHQQRARGKELGEFDHAKLHKATREQVDRDDNRQQPERPQQGTDTPT